MMLCRADFEELFPHLFHPESEPKNEPKSEARPDPMAPQPAKLPVAARIAPRKGENCRAHPAPKRQSAAIGPQPLTGQDWQDLAMRRTVAATLSAAAAYGTAWSMLSDHNRMTGT